MSLVTASLSRCLSSRVGYQWAAVGSVDPKRARAQARAAYPKQIAAAGRLSSLVAAGTGSSPARILAALLLSVTISAASQAQDAPDGESTTPPVPESPGGWVYGEQGLEYQSSGGNRFRIGLRFQTRFEDLTVSLSVQDSDSTEQRSELGLNRGRLKMGGTLLAQKLDLYMEYDQPSSNLLDYRATVGLSDNLKLRIGQWKSEFNRERIDSSGNLQMADRSLANYWFTIDRQPGIALHGRSWRGSQADSSWWAEYLSGQGRGGKTSSDSGLWLGRWQWNPNGEVLPFSQSELRRRPSPITSLAVAMVAGESPFTRFSSAGGGQLPGFVDGDYDLQQLLFETAAHYRGISWQQELHFKRIKDRSSGARHSIKGFYLQLGTFPSEWLSTLPRQLELAARYALVDPDTDTVTASQREVSLACNWFINGHRNKLTLEYSRLDADFADQPTRGHRVRLQWELSI